MTKPMHVKIREAFQETADEWTASPTLLYLMFTEHLYFKGSKGYLYQSDNGHTLRLNPKQSNFKDTLDDIAMDLLNVKILK